MATIATLVAKLVGDIGPFQSSMKQAEQESKGIGARIAGGMNGALGTIGDVAKIAGTAVVAGIGAMAAGMTLAVKEAADAEKNLAQLDAVLKSTGGAAGVSKDAILELAGALQKSTTFSDDEVIAADNLLLTFTQIGKDVFPDATRAVLDMSVALGQDAKASAMQLGKALNDPIKGVTALRKVGVSFTEEQMKQIKAMAAAGDVAGAQTLILKELQKEFGGSAEAAGKTLTGSLTILKNAGLDILETIGTALLPMLTQLAQGLRDALDNPAVQAGIQAIMTGFGQFTSVVLPQIIARAQEVVAWVQTNWPIISAEITRGLEGVRTAIGPIVEGISNFIQGVFGAIGTFLQTHGAEIQGFITTAWTGISEIVNTITAIVSGVVSNVFNAIATFINEHGAQIQIIVDTVWKQIRVIVETAINVVKTIINTVMAVLKGDWSTVWNNVKSIVNTIWNAITTLWTNFWNGVDGILRTMGSSIQGVWDGFWNGVRATVEQIWNGIKQFIQNAVNGVIDVINGMIEGFNSSLGQITGALALIPHVNLFATGQAAGAAYADGVNNGLQSKMAGGGPWPAMAGAGAWGTSGGQGGGREAITVNVYVERMASDIDTHRMAMQVARIIRENR